MPTPGGASQLSHGIKIEYKAFARRFQPNEGAVLYLIASCYYDSGGWTISFEPDAGAYQFKLTETPPSHAHTQMVTYYVASWTNGVSASQLPSAVAVSDAHGQHQVNVQPW